MKPKLLLTNIFLQSIVVLLSSFLVLTQLGTMRQPTKLFVIIMCVASLLVLSISIFNYIKMDKE